MMVKVNYGRRDCEGVRWRGAEYIFRGEEEDKLNLLVIRLEGMRKDVTKVKGRKETLLNKGSG